MRTRSRSLFPGASPLIRYSNCWYLGSPTIFLSCRLSYKGKSICPFGHTGGEGLEGNLVQLSVVESLVVRFYISVHVGRLQLQASPQLIENSFSQPVFLFHLDVFLNTKHNSNISLLSGHTFIVFLMIWS